MHRSESLSVKETIDQFQLEQIKWKVILRRVKIRRIQRANLLWAELSRAEQTNSTHIWTQATLVEGEWWHYCPRPVPKGYAIFAPFTKTRINSKEHWTQLNQRQIGGFRMLAHLHCFKIIYIFASLNKTCVKEVRSPTKISPSSRSISSMKTRRNGCMQGGCGGTNLHPVALLLFTTTADMADECKRCHSKLAELTSIKKGEDNSTIMT